jgi:hypothetical protein
LVGVQAPAGTQVLGVVERDAAQALGGELPGGIEPAAAGEGEAGLRAALHEGGDAQGGPGPAGVADDGGLVAHEAVGIDAG